MSRVRSPSPAFQTAGGTKCRRRLSLVGASHGARRHTRTPRTSPEPSQHANPARKGQRVVAVGAARLCEQTHGRRLIRRFADSRGVVAPVAVANVRGRQGAAAMGPLAFAGHRNAAHLDNPIISATQAWPNSPATCRRWCLTSASRIVGEPTRKCWNPNRWLAVDGTQRARRHGAKTRETGTLGPSAGLRGLLGPRGAIARGDVG
jgi:hypothetical protein